MFKSRFYNKIEDCGDLIKKSSTNPIKLSEEIKFYLKIPKSLKKYFPKIIEADNKGFSYKIEKIKSPTASELFLKEYDMMYTDCVEQLDAAFGFLQNRPVEIRSSKESCKYLYSDKVFSRYHLFKKTGLYDKMASNVIYNQFILKYEDLLCRYFKLANQILIPCDYVSYHHGDFCLTNMFMVDKQLKLIDPMGYDKNFKNMHDPLYDVAKLSHSILGNYDRILSNEYKILLKEKGFPFSLDLPQKDAFAKIYFFHALKKYKYDYDQVRIREASLFLSMLPLHPESLRRLSAFILQAESIIFELESKYAKL